MYTSAMKFCGAMELCGIGYPTDEPADYQWPDVEKQIEAQKAGLLIAMTRGHKPVEAELMQNKGFAPVYQFKNPRTGTVATLWIKDYTEAGKWQTKLPPQIVVQQARTWDGAPTPASDLARIGRIMRYNEAGPIAPLANISMEPEPTDATELRYPQDAFQAQIDRMLDLYSNPRIMVNVDSVSSPESSGGLSVPPCPNR